ncbi:THUMP domain-containing protein [Mycena indigotica]|uniref:THUMP domain-containing protein n=1 Tax=Mycena indigotica TaxID=2126181 RepID=A0A8H6T655_9AGAR|nr:THUMP domain-containing protein [Mycena indigotica]KAF7312493.1 THUMP domain-containing protein [Mycena indigotica]
MSNKRPSTSQGGKDSRKRKKYRSDGTPIWGRRHVEGPGVWITCVKGKERQAAGEACELFQNLAADLWPDAARANQKDSDDSESDGEGLSIEQQIANEVNAIKTRPTKTQELFKNCPTDTACLLFISCPPHVDPVKLVEKHLNNVDETGVTHTRSLKLSLLTSIDIFLRHCLRFSPVSASCTANVPEIETLCRKAFASAFSGAKYKFKIELKLRNHTTMTRDTLIAAVAQCVPKDDGHSVNLENPDLVILIEVFKSICGVSVVRDYQRLKKFNVTEVAGARKLADDPASIKRV